MTADCPKARAMTPASEGLPDMKSMGTLMP